MPKTALAPTKSIAPSVSLRKPHGSCSTVSAWRCKPSLSTRCLERLRLTKRSSGGKARNMHKSKREAKIQGRGTVGKTVVMGLLNRHGVDEHSTVQAQVVPDTKRQTLSPGVRSHVEPGSTVYTDAHSGYTGLDRDFIHEVIDHAEEYVRGKYTPMVLKTSGVS